MSKQGPQMSSASVHHMPVPQFAGPTPVQYGGSSKQPSRNGEKVAGLGTEVRNEAQKTGPLPPLIFSDLNSDHDQASYSPLTQAPPHIQMPRQRPSNPQLAHTARGETMNLNQNRPAIRMPIPPSRGQAYVQPPSGYDNDGIFSSNLTESRKQTAVDSAEGIAVTDSPLNGPGTPRAYRQTPPPQIPSQVRDQIAQQVWSSPQAFLPSLSALSVSTQGSPAETAPETVTPKLSGASVANSPSATKPTPRRHHASGANNNFGGSEVNGIVGIGPGVVVPSFARPVLDVEAFETVRRYAVSQPDNPAVQLDLAKKLSEAANVLAGRYTDPQNPSTLQVDPQQEARNREAWIGQAYKITKRLAVKSVYPAAIFFLGASYSSGDLGLERDDAKALECYHKAAKLNFPEACYRMAVVNEFGRGTRRDIDKALSWYKKAAHLGSVSSMYKLGMLSLHGALGQPRNLQEGLTWLQRAAEKADTHTPHAVHELALMYERSPASCYIRGDPLPRNDAKALELYYKAAKLGYAPSQSRLGHAYEFGELGCEVDPARSVSWYLNAAQQGDADGELGMCGWYWTGSERVIRQADTEAFLWAERAANRGHARGLFALGYFYEVGIGVSPTIQRAREYYLKAAEKRHPRALERLRELDRAHLSE